MSFNLEYEEISDGDIDKYHEHKLYKGIDETCRKAKLEQLATDDGRILHKRFLEIHPQMPVYLRPFVSSKMNVVETIERIDDVIVSTVNCRTEFFDFEERVTCKKIENNKLNIKWITTGVNNVPVSKEKALENYRSIRMSKLRNTLEYSKQPDEEEEIIQ